MQALWSAQFYNMYTDAFSVSFMQRLTRTGVTQIRYVIDGKTGRYQYFKNKSSFLYECFTFSLKFIFFLFSFHMTHSSGIMVSEIAHPIIYYWYVFNNLLFLFVNMPFIL